MARITDYKTDYRRIVAGMLLAGVTGFGWGFSGGGPVNPDGCSALTGCITCVPNSCPSMEEGWTIHTIGTGYVDRCVDYDHVAPNHCAAVFQTQKEIRDGMGFPVAYCYTHVCCYGTPTSEECSIAYSCP